MKKHILLFVLTFASTFAFGQTKEQTTLISIENVPNLKVCSDKDTIGHKVGDVIIQKTLTSKFSKMYSKQYSFYSYQVHFYKTYKNKLRDYFMEHAEPVDFDNASYNWLDDKTVLIILINSTTQERRKLKLTQTFCDNCSPALDTDLLKAK